MNLVLIRNYDGCQADKKLNQIEMGRVVYYPPAIVGYLVLISFSPDFIMETIKTSILHRNGHLMFHFIISNLFREFE